MVPDNIVGTFAIANSSNEEIFYTNVQFSQRAQFPLRFTVVITNDIFPSGTYLSQLQIFKVPRQYFDLPLWTAESMDYIVRSSQPNPITFRAYNDSKEFEYIKKQQQRRIQFYFRSIYCSVYNGYYFKYTSNFS